MDYASEAVDAGMEHTMTMGPRTLRALFLVALATILLSGLGSASAETRHALVIGNSAYKHVGPLRNPENDASLIAERLEKVGFTVTKLLNADLAAMRRAVRDFASALTDPDSVALFYYAGHGAQVHGQNYLVPVDANVKHEDAVAAQAINANDFLKAMEESPSRINVMVLDACRNNPFASRFRSASRGLARMDAARGSYIAYATAPGDVAVDGEGRNSPYTKALSDALTQQGLTIEQVFKRTRREVLAATGDRQTPWESSSITGEFFFVPGERPAAQPTAPPAPPVVQVPRIAPAPPEPGTNCFTFNNEKICE